MKRSDVLIFISGMLACLFIGLYFGIATAQSVAAGSCLKDGKWKTTVKLVSDKPIAFLCQKDTP